MGRVSGLASRAMMSTMVSGTDRKTPMVPNTNPQNSSERNTARVEIPQSAAHKAGLQDAADDRVDDQITQGDQQVGGS